MRSPAGRHTGSPRAVKHNIPCWVHNTSTKVLLPLPVSLTGVSLISRGRRCALCYMLMSRRLHHLFLVPSLGDNFQVVPSLNSRKWHHFLPLFFFVAVQAVYSSVFLNNPKTGDMLIENNQSIVIWSPCQFYIFLFSRVCSLSGWRIMRCTCLLNCLSCHGSYRWGLD